MNNYTEEPEFDETKAPSQYASQGDAADQTSEQSLEQELAEWKDLAMRRAAEMENMRRRVAAEKELLVQYASEKLLIKILPVVDDLHNAVEAAKTTNDVQALKEGLSMIYVKTIKILSEVGVTAIEGGIGEPFDVDLHEALMHMPSEVTEGHVVQQIQRGYRLHDRVLRHAKVVTSAGSDSNTENR